MDYIKPSVGIFIVLLLAGCATTPQPEISLANNYWDNPDQNVGVYVGLAKIPQFYMEGDVRLLDYAINAGVMSALTNHLEKLDISDYSILRDEIADILSDQGKSVKLLIENNLTDDFPSFEDRNKEDTIYYAIKDYTELKKKLGIDQLLIIKPSRIGIARAYYGFMPMGDPRAVFEVHGELVDLQTNQLLWYANVKHEKYSSGNWDEPPSYPGLTNSFYSALEETKRELLSHFIRNSETPIAQDQQ